MYNQHPLSFQTLTPRLFHHIPRLNSHKLSDTLYVPAIMSYIIILIIYKPASKYINLRTSFLHNIIKSVQEVFILREEACTLVEKIYCSFHLLHIIKFSALHCKHLKASESSRHERLTAHNSIPYGLIHKLRAFYRNPGIFFYKIIPERVKVKLIVKDSPGTVI